MWRALLLSTALAAQTPGHEAVADGVRLYFDGQLSAAAAVFETLHAERPHDERVAWWTARTRLDLGRAAEALPLVANREGHHLPTWSHQALAAKAHLVLGEREAARLLLDLAWPEVTGTADRPGLAAAYGLLLAEQGEDPLAAQVLREAGPQPLRVLDPVLLGVLAPAAVFDVAPHSAGQLDLTRADGTWRVDLATGLARPAPEDPGPPAAWRGASGPRGRPDRCPGRGEAWVWTSPAEPLADELPGVYRHDDSGLARLALTPPGAVDLSPACLGESVWFIRRLGEQAGLLRLDGQALSELAPQPGAVATVDVRAGRAGVPELVLGLVVEGRPEVWLLQGGRTARPLVTADQSLLAPRWVD